MKLLIGCLHKFMQGTIIIASIYFGGRDGGLWRRHYLLIINVDVNRSAGMSPEDLYTEADLREMVLSDPSFIKDQGL